MCLSTDGVSSPNLSGLSCSISPPATSQLPCAPGHLHHTCTLNVLHVRSTCNCTLQLHILMLNPLVSHMTRVPSTCTPPTPRGRQPPVVSPELLRFHPASPRAFPATHELTPPVIVSTYFSYSEFSRKCRTISFPRKKSTRFAWYTASPCLTPRLPRILSASYLIASSSCRKGSHGYSLFGGLDSIGCCDLML